MKSLIDHKICIIGVDLVMRRPLLSTTLLPAIDDAGR